MISKLVKLNEQGRRIGDSHPRATLTDAEVTLMQMLLDARAEFIEKLAGQPAHVVRDLLLANGLSYRLIAEKFETSKAFVADVNKGRRRCQTPYA